MIRTRVLLASALAVGAVVLAPPGGPGVALAQPASPASGGISAALKASGDPEAVRAAVAPFIRDRAAKLSEADPVVRETARRNLIDESGALTDAGPSAPSATYLDVYSAELNTVLLELLAAPSLEVRLNAAIVAARVARGDRGARLVPSVVAAMGDKADPVVLWGLKGAAQLVAPTLSAGGAARTSPILAKVIELAPARRRSMMAVEVYDALTLTSFSTPADVLRSQIRDDAWQRMAPVVMPELATVWAGRLTTWADKTAAPVEPGAESIPVQFLVPQRTWGALSPEQRAQAVQLLSDQLALAGERAASGTGDREAYLAVFTQTAKLLQVIGDQRERSAELSTAARAAAAIGPNSSPAAIRAASEGVLPAIKSIPAFAQTQPASRLMAQ